MAKLLIASTCCAILFGVASPLAADTLKLKTKADADAFLDMIQAQTYQIDLMRPMTADTPKQLHKVLIRYDAVISRAESLEPPGDSRIAHAYADLSRSSFNAFDLDDAERYANDVER